MTSRKTMTLGACLCALLLLVVSTSGGSAASVPPDAFVAPTATRTPTRAPTGKATPTPVRRLVRAGDPPTTVPSSLILQNLDPNNSMHSRLSYYDGLSGQLLLQTAMAGAILPSRSVWISQGSQQGLPATFSGNALVDSDTPFGMVVVESNGWAGTLGKNFKVDGYTAWPSTLAGTEILLPQIVKNIGTAPVVHNCLIVIQNTHPTSAANVTIRYKANTGQEYVHSNIDVPPSASTTVDVLTDSALQSLSSFYGSGRVLATQPVAVLRYGYTSISSNIYGGMTTAHAGTTLYMPQLLKSFVSGPNTTVGTAAQAMTVDGTPANFTLTYRDMNTGIVYVETQTGVSLAAFDQRFSTVLPNGFFGSGVLTSDKQIVGIVNIQTNYDEARGIRATTYRAMPAARGGPNIYLPFLAKNTMDTTTGVSWGTATAVRLAGGSSTTVTLTHYLPNGQTVQQTAALSSTSPMAILDQRFNSSLPDGNVMAGVLTTNPPSTIVASVNVQAMSTNLGDTSMSYEGIAQ